MVELVSLAPTLRAMNDDVDTWAAPQDGLGVLHLFWKVSAETDRDGVLAALAGLEAQGDQAIAITLLGHKADLGVMALSSDLRRLRKLQTDLRLAGLELVDSYLSLTEVSEYAAGLPEHMKKDRLFPALPPEAKRVWCFYPMSKRRNSQENWYTLDFDRRREMMMEHGTSGRAFAGRIVQLITASTGLDAYEWGVTLFAERPDDVKEVVYTLRYDEASAVYAEFGPFYVGFVAAAAESLDSIGVT